jgi:hypothetical protein
MREILDTLNLTDFYKDCVESEDDECEAYFNTTLNQIYSDYPCGSELDSCMSTHYQNADSQTKTHHEMITNHVTTPVIETGSYIDRPFLNKKLIGSRLSLYMNVKQTGYLYKPYKVYRFEHPEPLDTSLYTISHTDRVDNFVFDQTRMKELVTVDDYDQNGNILKFSKPNDTYTSFVWDYNDYYPIAKIETGSDYDLTAEQINQIKELKNAYTYGELDSINTLIRDNTAYPIDANISTFTYKPSIGQTSICGPNGKSAYYEYDGLGRLNYIKDHNENVIKHIYYHTIPYETPPISNITGETQVISGDTVEYSILPVDGAYIYNWTIPGDALVVEDNNSNILKVIFKCSGEVNISVTSKEWCDVLNKSISVAASPPEIILMQPTEILPDQVHTFRVRDEKGQIDNCDWVISGDATLISDNDTTIDVSFQGAANIVVDVHSSKWCAVPQKSFSFTPVAEVYSLTGPDIIDTDTFSTVDYTVTGSEGVEFEWVLDPGLGNCITSSISTDGKTLTLDHNQGPFCFYPDPLTIKVRAKWGSTYSNWEIKTVTFIN